MADEPQWQSPGDPPRQGGDPVPPVPPVTPSFPPLDPGHYAPLGSPPPPPPGAPQNGRAQNGYGQNGYGQGEPGWTPPPKPGLIPLRPLDVGTILGSSFRVLRRNPRPTFGAALVIQGIVSLLIVLVVGGATFFALTRIGSSTSKDAGQITAGAVGLIVIAAIIPVFFAIMASAFLQGIIVLEVSRGAVGEKSTFRQLWQRAKGRVWALIGWTLLVILAVTVATAILVGIIVALASTAAAAGIVIAVLVGIFGALGAVVLYFWLGTRLSLVPSVLMIERLTLGRAIVRSWSLTQGGFWRTLGIQLLVTVIIGVVSQVISAPFNLLSPLLAGLLDPNGQNGPTVFIVIAAFGLLSVIISVVFGAITSVVQTATTALLYLDRRIRKEGLDLELAHFVEARQAGDASVVDPLLHSVPQAGYSSAPHPPSDRSPWS
ncbi:hypothetical protein [Glaciihabitans sp. UYNi722]|uniref:hypothetical protein n=1 Tax=Glaciihabitans sp. UYNi722 TaxID=3156344 RepID=UPI003397C075